MESKANEITHVVQGMRMGGIEKGGKLFFNADDVVRHLGYLHPQEAIERHCRNVDTSIVPGVQMISESDFYRLIFRSRKPEAKAFVRWVCHDVLPSIRKHGFYGTKSFAEQIQNATPDEIRDLARRLLAERDERRGDKAADDAYWPPHLRSDVHKGSVIKTRADLKKWLAENAATTATNNKTLSDVPPNGQNAPAGRETSNGGLFDREATA